MMTVCGQQLAKLRHVSGLERHPTTSQVCARRIEEHLPWMVPMIMELCKELAKNFWPENLALIPIAVPSVAGARAAPGVLTEDMRNLHPQLMC